MGKNKISLFDAVTTALQLKERAREAFFMAAQQGNASALAAYSRANAKFSNGLQKDKEVLLDRIMTAPQNYKNLPEIIGAITTQAFSFEKFFTADTDREGKLWSMYARHASPETANAAAELVAEYLRYQLLHDENYRVDLNRPLGAWPQDDLSFAMKEQQRRDAIVATQHALVRYVSENGDTLPLNRGAAFLKFMTGDYPPETSSIWSKPIQTLAEQDVHDQERGMIARVDPVFAP